MYESQTFEVILQRMLSRIPDNMDKRPGSIIYDALAPAAAEAAIMYIAMDVNNELSFADTAEGIWLSKRTAEFGVNRIKATSALRQGEFFDESNGPMDVPIGSRFSIEDLIYKVKDKISQGIFTLESESTGAIGNQSFGSSLPLAFIAGLSRAEVTAILIPGEEEEDDASLRNRFYEIVNKPAFGGNVADYKQSINEMAGIGGTKVFPVWNGGGTVKCTVIASDWSEPTSTLITEIQNWVDPAPNSGEGNGTAPIGHQVTIVGVQGVQTDITTNVTLAANTTLGQVKSQLESVIGSYLEELRKNWSSQTQIIIRIAQLEARILAVDGIDDVSDTSINASASNLELGEEQIPLLGVVVVNG